MVSLPSDGTLGKYTRRSALLATYRHSLLCVIRPIKPTCSCFLETRSRDAFSCSHFLYIYIYTFFPFQNFFFYSIYRIWIIFILIRSIQKSITSLWKAWVEYFDAKTYNRTSLHNLFETIEWLFLNDYHFRSSWERVYDRCILERVDLAGSRLARGLKDLEKGCIPDPPVRIPD